MEMKSEIVLSTDIWDMKTPNDLRVLIGCNSKHIKIVANKIHY